MFSVALCSDKSNRPVLEILKPSIMLFSEADIRNFIYQADAFYSDVDISDEFGDHLGSIGVPRDLQYVVPDIETAFQVLQVSVLRIQNLMLAARLREVKGQE